MANPYQQAGFVEETAAAPDDLASSPYAQAGFVAEPPPSGPGILESFGRGALSGATFGFEDELGIADRAAQTRARQANPWTHFAGEMVGGLAPMIASGGVGAVARGATLAARGARGIAGLFAPGQMNTLGQAATQGAKMGVTYGGLSGAGHADPNPNATATEAAVQRGLGAGMGAGVGLALGPALGAAGYGAGRLLGAAVARLSPEMQDALAAARDPQSQGVRDIMRHLGYDNFTDAEFQAVRAALRDPNQAHRFSGLNLVEALEVGRPPAPVVQQASRGDWQRGLTNAVDETPPLQQPMRPTPNTSDWAQDMANTGGAGRHDAVESFVQRQAAMPGRVSADVDHFFGTGGDNLEATIARFFGTGTREADQAAIAAQRAAFNRRYERLEGATGPFLVGADLRPSFNSRAIRNAMLDAAENDITSNPATAGRWRWLQNPSGIPAEAGQPLILSPRNILDIHHSLVMQAKPTVGRDAAELLQAQRIKSWFTNWVDNSMRGHKSLRQDYALFKRQMEAAEMGASLPINTGGNHKALTFFQQTQGELANLERGLAPFEQRGTASMARFRAGEQAVPRLESLTKQMNRAEAYDEVLDAFRKSWGERIQQEIASTTNPTGVIQRLLTKEGRDRTNMIIGDEQGAQFSRYLYGRLIKEQLAGAKSPADVNRIVRDHLSPRGQRQIMDQLGPEDGTAFIESLFNKQQQAGLSQRLFGNSNTHYKMARHKKAEYMSDAASAAGSILSTPLMPWNLPAVPNQLWKLGQAVRNIGSSHYAQRRADQANALLSRQGPEDVGRILDTIIARNQLQAVGRPFTVEPMRPLIGPAASEVPSWQQHEREIARRRRMGLPT